MVKTKIVWSIALVLLVSILYSQNVNSQNVNTGCCITKTNNLCIDLTAEQCCGTPSNPSFDACKTKEYIKQSCYNAQNEDGKKICSEDNKGCCCDKDNQGKIIFGSGKSTYGIGCTGNNKIFSLGKNCIKDNTICPAAACGNGVDDDRDGCIDFDMDYGCTDKNDQTEGGKEEAGCKKRTINCDADKPSITVVTATRINNEKRIALTWADECKSTADSYKIYRCQAPAVSAASTSCEPTQDIATVDKLNYDDSSVSFNVEYRYKILGFYQQSGTTKEGNPKLSDPISIGNEKCFGKEAEPICDGKKPAVCSDGKIRYLQDSDCQGACIVDKEKREAKCVNFGGCDKDNEANPFGLYYKDNTQCEADDKYCYFDYKDSIVKSCLDCKPDMSCYDYKSRDTCEDRNPCKISGDCKWNPLPSAQDIGAGVCISKNDYNCKFCDTQTPYNSILEVCTKEKSDALGYVQAGAQEGTSKFTCLFKEDKQKSEDCNKVTCMDYTKEQCGAQKIGLDSNKNIVTPSSDKCGIRVCEFVGNKCVKDADGDGKGDCTDIQVNNLRLPCESDYIPPETTPNKVDSKGRTTELSFTINDKVSITGKLEDKTKDGKYLTYLCVQDCNNCLGQCEGDNFPVSTNDRKLSVKDFVVMDSNGNNIIVVNEEKHFTIKYYTIDPNKNVEPVKSVKLNFARSFVPQIRKISITDKDGTENTLSSDKNIYTNANNPTIKIILAEGAEKRTVQVKNANLKRGAEIISPQGAIPQSDSHFEIKFQNLNDGLYDFEFDVKDVVTGVEMEDNQRCPNTISEKCPSKVVVDTKAPEFKIKAGKDGKFKELSTSLTSQLLTKDDVTVAGKKSKVKILLEFYDQFDNLEIESLTITDTSTNSKIKTKIDNAETDNLKKLFSKTSKQEAGRTTIIFSAEIELPDGEYQIDAAAKDFAGNSDSKSGALILNAIPLDILLSSPQFKVAPSDKFNLEVKTDNRADCEYQICRLNNNVEGCGNIIKFTATKSFIHKVETESIEGGANVKVMCNDGIESKVATWPFSVEITIPKIDNLRIYPSTNVAGNIEVGHPPAIQTIFETIVEGSIPKKYSDTICAVIIDSGIKKVFDDGAAFKHEYNEEIDVKDYGDGKLHTLSISCKNRAGTFTETTASFVVVDKGKLEVTLIKPKTPIIVPPQSTAASNIEIEVETTKKSNCEYRKASETPSGNSAGKYLHTFTIPSLAIDAKETRKEYNYFVKCDVGPEKKEITVKIALERSTFEVKPDEKPIKVREEKTLTINHGAADLILEGTTSAICKASTDNLGKNQIKIEGIKEGDCNIDVKDKEKPDTKIGTVAIKVEAGYTKPTLKTKPPATTTTTTNSIDLEVTAPYDATEASVYNKDDASQLVTKKGDENPNTNAALFTVKFDKLKVGQNKLVAKSKVKGVDSDESDIVVVTYETKITVNEGLAAPIFITAPDTTHSKTIKIEIGTKKINGENADNLLINNDIVVDKRPVSDGLLFTHTLNLHLGQNEITAKARKNNIDSTEAKKTITYTPTIQVLKNTIEDIPIEYNNPDGFVFEETDANNACELIGTKNLKSQITGVNNAPLKVKGLKEGLECTVTVKKNDVSQNTIGTIKIKVVLLGLTHQIVGADQNNLFAGQKVNLKIVPNGDTTGVKIEIKDSQGINVRDACTDFSKECSFEKTYVAGEYKFTAKAIKGSNTILNEYLFSLSIKPNKAPTAAIKKEGQCDINSPIKIICTASDDDKNLKEAKIWYGICDNLNTAENARNCFDSRKFIDSLNPNQLKSHNPTPAPTTTIQNPSGVYEKIYTIPATIKDVGGNDVSLSGKAFVATCKGTDTGGLESKDADAYPLCIIGADCDLPVFRIKPIQSEASIGKLELYVEYIPSEPTKQIDGNPEIKIKNGGKILSKPIAITGPTGTPATYKAEFIIDADFEDGQTEIIVSGRERFSTAQCIGSALTSFNVNKARAEDKEAPVISEIIPGNNAIISSQTPTISAAIGDASGVDLSSIILRIDGVQKSASRNPSSGTPARVTISYTSEPLASKQNDPANIHGTPGKHIIEIIVKDTRGNNNEKAPAKSEFIVDIESILPKTISLIGTGDKIDIVSNGAETALNIIDKARISKYAAPALRIEYGEELKAAPAVSLTKALNNPDGTLSSAPISFVAPSTSPKVVSYTLPALSEGKYTLTIIRDGITRNFKFKIAATNIAIAPLTMEAKQPQLLTIVFPHPVFDANDKFKFELNGCSFTQNSPTTGTSFTGVANAAGKCTASIKDEAGKILLGASEIIISAEKPLAVNNVAVIDAGGNIVSRKDDKANIIYTNIRQPSIKATFDKTFAVSVTKAELVHASGHTINTKTILPLQSSGGLSNNVMLQFDNAQQDLADGTYTFKLYINNNNAPLATAAIVIDSTPPLNLVVSVGKDYSKKLSPDTASILPLNAEDVVGAEKDTGKSIVPIKIEAEDKNNVELTSLTIDTIEYKNFDYTVQGDKRIFTVKADSPIKLSEGVHTLRVKLCDIAGTRGNCYQTGTPPVSDIDYKFDINAFKPRMLLKSPTYGFKQYDGSNQLRLEISTPDKATRCRYFIDKEITNEQMRDAKLDIIGGIFDGGDITGNTHVKQLTITDDKEHEFIVKCDESQTDSQATSDILRFKIGIIRNDISPLAITAVAKPKPVVEKKKGAKLIVKSNRPVICQYKDSKDNIVKNFEGYSDVLHGATFKLEHSQKLDIDKEGDGQKTYQITCKDRAGWQAQATESFNIDPNAVNIDKTKIPTEFVYGNPVVLTIETNAERICFFKRLSPHKEDSSSHTLSQSSRNNEMIDNNIYSYTSGDLRDKNPRDGGIKGIISPDTPFTYEFTC